MFEEIFKCVEASFISNLTLLERVDGFFLPFFRGKVAFFSYSYYPMAVRYSLSLKLSRPKRVKVISLSVLKLLIGGRGTWSSQQRRETTSVDLDDMVSVFVPVPVLLIASNICNVCATKRKLLNLVHIFFLGHQVAAANESAGGPDPPGTSTAI